MLLLTGLFLAGEAVAGVLPAAIQIPAAGPADDRQAELLTHDLAVELVPAGHRLLATDRITLKVLSPQLEQVSFSLNSALRVTRIQQGRGSELFPLAFSVGARGAGEGEWPEQSPQVVTVQLAGPAARDQVLTLEWAYEGTINDPPRESRDLRYVTPSDTTGHIGSEGVYLSGESHWYPDLPGSLATVRLRATVPEGWETVSHGRQVSRAAAAGTVTVEWHASTRTEALTLVANRFQVSSREWRDRAGQAIEVATYLFPDDAPLADEYLDASVRYLEAYTTLLGPYPFQKFAVVENFFPSGLGMPSFTLLGSGIVKRHYVQPFALGHEIVHSWIGNSVFNDVEQGNWVEGLTTYLANYYYDELIGKSEPARDQRRLMLLGYAVYVRPEEDYPVERFRQKTDQKDNAIGYQKAAMLFHMLRREIGEEAFWGGLRRLVAEYKGAYATWRELERVFGESAGRDLRWFFAQWVERAGAPSLRIENATARPETTGDGGDRPHRISARIRQIQADGSGGPYRLRLPVRVALAGGAIYPATVDVDSADQQVSLLAPAAPVALEIDPDFEIFRRLDRDRIPPMLNLYVTDHERTVVLPDQGAETERAPYRDVAARLAAPPSGPESGAGPAARTEVLETVPGEPGDRRGSVLVLGGPGLNRAADWAVRGCEDNVAVQRDRFTVEGRTYQGADLALLVSCRHPSRPEAVVTLFYGITPAATAKVARLLFFYGWQSYLVFRDGAVVARGDFVPLHEELKVRFAEQ